MQYFRGFNPVHDRHDNIHQGDVWQVLFTQGNPFLAICPLADQLDIGGCTQGRLHDPVHLEMVVNKDNSDVGGFGLCHQKVPIASGVKMGLGNNQILIEFHLI